MVTLWVKFSLNIYQVTSGFKEEPGDTWRLPNVHVGAHKYTQRGDKDEPISGKSTWIGDYLWGLEIIFEVLRLFFHFLFILQTVRLSDCSCSVPAY